VLLVHCGAASLVALKAQGPGPVGDPWSLLVVRDVVFYGKHTFGEFLSSAQISASLEVWPRLSSSSQPKTRTMIR
jgi:hypothetical protein